MAPPARVPEELTRGPFTLARALAAGLTRRQLQGSTWKRIGRGWYVFADLDAGSGVPLAGLLASLPQGSVIAGLTAARIHGFAESVGRPEVIVPPTPNMSARAPVTVRNVRLAASEVTRVHGLPVTTPVRTCFDLACRLPLVEAVVLVDAALHRRLVSLAELQSQVAGHPRVPGVRQARHILELAEPAAESPMETRLRLILVLAGLPRPAAQVSLHDDVGRFLARPDLYYSQARLAIEYDGGTHRDSLTADNRRQNGLQRAGIKLLRYTAPDVHGRPEAIVAEVSAMLRSRRAKRTHSRVVKRAVRANETYPAVSGGEAEPRPHGVSD